MLQQRLDPATRGRLVAAFESARVIQPGFNNWLLFAATVEAALKVLGARWDRMRVDYALRQHDQWYRGDGAYGDGPAFHWDYYNSFVIHPMLVDVLAAVRRRLAGMDGAAREGRGARDPLRGACSNGSSAPDGHVPATRPIHRLSLRRVPRAGAGGPAARPAGGAVTGRRRASALTAAIARSLDPPTTFDAVGWLTIGFAGHQPGIGERYISTGSLYLCAMALLPLGLPPADPFWASADEPWTAKRAWAGQGFSIDRALTEN